MSFDPFDPANFEEYAPCLPCCAPPAECACAMLVPYTFGSLQPAPDYATALAIATNPLQTQCYGYIFNSFGYTPDTFTVTPGTDSVELDYTRTPWKEFQMYCSVNVNAGDTINIVTSGTGGGSGGGDTSSVLVIIYNCAQEQVYVSESAPGPSGSFSFPVTVDGIYFVLILFAPGNFTQPGFTHGNAVVSATSMAVNPVIVVWDDSGTTRELEVCPKLLLPTYSHPPGTWFTDCATAASEMASGVVDSVAFLDPHEVSLGPYTTKSAAGGASFIWSSSQHDTDPSDLDMYNIPWFSFNAVAGDIISIAYSLDGLAGADGENLIRLQAAFSIYDPDGNFLDANSAMSSFSPSPLNFSGTFTTTIPLTGRYTMKLFSHYEVGFDTDPTVRQLDSSFTVTSSGEMSTNPIQALYHAGLDCPGRLDYGDSCA